MTAGHFCFCEKELFIIVFQILNCPWTDNIHLEVNRMRQALTALDNGQNDIFCIEVQSNIGVSLSDILYPVCNWKSHENPKSITRVWQASLTLSRRWYLENNTDPSLGNTTAIQPEQHFSVFTLTTVLFKRKIFLSKFRCTILRELYTKVRLPCVMVPFQ